MTATAEQIAVPASIVSNTAMLYAARGAAAERARAHRARARRCAWRRAQRAELRPQRTLLYVFHAGVAATDAQPATAGRAAASRCASTAPTWASSARPSTRAAASLLVTAGRGRGAGRAAAAAAVTEVRALHKTEDGLVCRTPRRAGRSELTIVINEHDYPPQGAPPLTHTYACEQLRG